MTYNAKWRKVKGLFRFWRTEKNLVGHRWFHDQNKMVLYFQDGSVREIAHWTDCEFQLGSDWALFTKNEKQANQPA